MAGMIFKMITRIQQPFVEVVFPRLRQIVDNLLQTGLQQFR